MTTPPTREPMGYRLLLLPYLFLVFRRSTPLDAGSVGFPFSTGISSRG